MAKTKKDELLEKINGKTTTSKTTKKTETNKDDLVKQKVESLLEGINPKQQKESNESKNVVESTTTKKTLSWLENEVERLTNINLKLEYDLEQLQKDYDNKLNNSEFSPVEINEFNEFRNKLSVIYKDIEKNYMGDNSQRTPYEFTKSWFLLNKLLTSFPFLQKIKNRNLAPINFPKN